MRKIINGLVYGFKLRLVSNEIGELLSDQTLWTSKHKQFYDEYFRKPYSILFFF